MKEGKRMTDTSNPLLDFTGLPRFDLIRPEHVTPAIEQLIADARGVVQQLEAPADTSAGTASWSRSRNRPSAWAAPGAWSTT
jgi:Zn-dependent oligopeptidase